jgi:predicted ATPase
MNRRDFLRRFISLIDALYYNHRNVIIEADVPLANLFAIDSAGHEKQIFHDEEFAYSRCLSRLQEMQTKQY